MTTPTGEPRTPRQWAESLRLVPATSKYGEGYNDGLTDLLEKIEAAAATEPRPDPALDALLDHVIELAEQYHSGHSVAGAACKCDQCRELRVIRREYARLAGTASASETEG